MSTLPYNGFKTGTGHLINISVESLEVSKKNFSNICHDLETFNNVFTTTSEKSQKRCDEHRPNSGSKEIYHDGFKTGSGKSIIVNAESIEASKIKFFDDRDKYFTFSNGHNDNCTNNFEPSVYHQLETFKNVFAATPGKIHEPCAQYRPNSDSKEVYHDGFQTGSGKSIIVNAESIEASKMKFFDNGDKYYTFSNRHNDNCTINFEPGVCHMLETFNNDLDGTSDNIDEQCDKHQPNIAPREVDYDGFKTGSGKSIIVSAESVEASRMNFFDDRDKNHTFSNSCNNNSAFNFEPPTLIDENIPTTTAIKDSQCLNSVDGDEFESSFDLGREIMECTSAFLYNVSNDDTFSFTPPTTNTTPNTFIDTQQNPAIGASPSSPIITGTFSRKALNRSSPVNKIGSTIYSQCVRNNTSTPVSAVTKSGKRKCFSYPLPTKKLNFSPITTGTVSDDDVNERAVRQQRYIDHKPPEYCKPFPGYYSTRVANAVSKPRFPLKQLVLAKHSKNSTIHQCIECGLPPNLLQITSQNAVHFVFSNEFISKELLTYSNCPVLFGDAAPIFMNSRNEVTLKEITRAFLASPGVDPKLVSSAWIANHYRWIVWKLASTERSFPNTFGQRYLTLDNVLFQLKFRYDREIDHCTLPALKKILEGDNSAAQPLVLCVAAIEKTSDLTQRYKVELTDGWYGIFAEIDEEMNKLISSRKVVIGTKLIIIGSQLVGWNQGCDPLKVEDSVRLKFSTNSCRRVRWYTRMGFYTGRIGPFCQINTLLPNGGLVWHVAAMVARVYPLLFQEKYDYHSGKAPLHNERAENKRAAEYEKKHHAIVEGILAEMDDIDFNKYRFEDRDKLNLIVQDRIESSLSEKFSKKRKVSRLLKLRLVNPNDENLSSAILTIWNPCEDVIDFFKEGKMYNFHNLHTNGIYSSANLLLSSNRFSRYDKCSPTNHPLSKSYRCITHVHELGTKNHSPAFGEVDMVGVVVRTCWYGDRRLIYLTDSEKNFFAISFRTDEQNIDHGDAIKRGKIIAGINLQWKKNVTWTIPILFGSEYTFFVESTRHKTIQQGIEELGNLFNQKNLNEFIEECEQKLDSITSLPGACTPISPPKSNNHMSAEPNIFKFN